MTKIFIDPGHGGRDSGAVGNGLREKDITLDLAKRIRSKLLNEYRNVTVVMSRTKDETLSLKARTDKANRSGADFLLSVHVNAGGGTGWESFVYNGRISVTTTSTQRQVHTSVMKQLTGIRDRGMKQANFHMLRESRMPALLTENLFIDNKNDAKKLKNSDFLNKIATGHVRGIAKAFNLKKKVKSNDKIIYKVFIGNYKRKTDADQAAEKAVGKGFSTFIKHEDGVYKVQIGAFTKKPNADSLAKKAEKAGFKVVVVKERTSY